VSLDRGHFTSPIPASSFISCIAMLDLALIEKLAVRPGPTGRFLERISDGTPFSIQADTGTSLWFSFEVPRRTLTV
jgi:hypothetical protein